MHGLPADSLPITNVIFWCVSIAERRAPRACVRKPRKEFLGVAMLIIVDGDLRFCGYCGGGI